MSVAAPIAGGLLVALTLREVFHMLFHPSGQGGASMAVFRALWRATARLGTRGRTVAGPLGMTAVIVLWVGAMVLGFALVYWPSMPEAFAYASALEPRSEGDLIDAIYFSAVTQTTVGYGSIAPEQGIFRMLAPLQAALGFGLFTMVVSWVLSVYPALQRQRAAASSLHALRLAHERQAGAGEVEPATLARQLEQVSEMLSQARVDFLQYPSTFFFAAPAPTFSLARALPFAQGLAERPGLDPAARPAAAQLGASLDLLADTLAEQHLDMAGAGTAAVLEAYRGHALLDDGEGSS